jgi:hypothetical protein
MQLLLYALISATVITSTISTDPPLVAFNCFEPQEISTFSLLEVGECSPPDVINTVQNKTVQVLLDPNFDLAPTISCSIITKFFITFCGAYSHSKAVRNYDRVIEISRDQCEEIHRTNQYKFYDQIIPVKANTSTLHSLIAKGTRSPDGTCTGDRFTDVLTGQTYTDVTVEVNLNIILSNHFAKVDIESGKIFLPGSVQCDYHSKDASCYDVFQGYSFWSRPTAPQRCERNYYHVLYNGPASIITSRDSPSSAQDDYLIVSSDTRNFAIKMENSFPACGLNLYSTEYPHIVLLFDTEYFQNSSRPINPDPNTFYLSKLMYLESQFKSDLQQLHQYSLHRRCLLEQSLLRTKLGLLQTSPQSAGHLLAPSPSGYGSLRLGETIQMQKCQPVVVKIRPLPEPLKCYGSLPITYGNNISAFLSPVSRIITEHAEEVICSKLAPVQFQLQPGLWITYSPEAHLVRTPPQILQPTKDTTLSFSKFQHVSTNGLYSTKEMTQYFKSISFPSSREAINSHMAHTLLGYNHENSPYHTYNLLSATDLENIATRTFKRLFWYLSAFGSVSSSIIGLVVCIHLIKYVLSTFIRCFQLHSSVGCSPLMFVSMWSALTQALLFYRANQHATQQAKTDLAERPPTQCATGGLPTLPTLPASVAPRDFPDQPSRPAPSRPVTSQDISYPQSYQPLDNVFAMSPILHPSNHPKEHTYSNMYPTVPPCVPPATNNHV